MDIKYFGPPKLKLNRILPKGPNSCRLSVYANAINHILGSSILTPELVLQSINQQRVAQGKTAIVLNNPSDFVTSTDLDNFVKAYYPQVLVKRIYGEKMIDLDFWKGLLSHNFVFSFYHQMLYDDYFLPQNEEAFLYFDKYVLKECVNAKAFDYAKSKAICELLIRKDGIFDAGHTDLVLDVIYEEGLPYVVFANLNSVKNSGLIKVPFNLLKYFALLDWENAQGLTSSSQLPTEEQFTNLRTTGRLDFGGFNFVYGMQEIFYTKQREELLTELLVPKKKSFPTPLLALLLVLLTPLMLLFSNRNAPRLNLSSMDINNPNPTEESINDVVSRNQPKDVGDLVVGNDMCKVFSKEAIGAIAAAKVLNAQNFAEAGAVWCEYTIEGQSPSTFTIYYGAVSADSERIAQTALGKTIKTYPEIKRNHFVTEDGDGNLLAVYIIVNKNRFIRMDRSSKTMINDPVLIDLANNLRGFQ